MKIVHFIFTLQYGGAETLLVDLVNEQVNHNDVSVFIINNDYSEKLINTIDKRAKVILFNRTKSSLNIFKWLKIIYAVFRLNPHVIHCHDSKAIFFIPFPFYKTILTVHAMSLSLKGISLYNTITSISKAVYDDVLIRKLKESVVIYNGIITEQMKWEPHKNTRFLIVQISRLQHEIKGQHLLLEALHVVNSQFQFTEWSLDLIGEGESRVFLEKEIERLGLSSQVKLLGERKRDYIYNSLYKYDLLVQPSIREGFGLTIIEGMAARVATLVSDINAPMEIIKDGKYGFFFKSQDINSCAKQLFFIMTNALSRTSMADEAYNYCREQFSLKETSHEYEKLYSKLISQ